MFLSGYSILDLQPCRIIDPTTHDNKRCFSTIKRFWINILEKHNEIYTWKVVLDSILSMHNSTWPWVIMIRMYKNRAPLLMETYHMCPWGRVPYLCARHFRLVPRRLLCLYDIGIIAIDILPWTWPKVGPKINGPRKHLYCIGSESLTALRYLYNLLLPHL